jgi:molybdate transport system substrate-binding protein
MRRIRSAWAALVVAIALPAAAVDVKVLSAGAVKTAFTEAVAAWQRETGHHVVATFAPASELRKKAAAGDASDVLIVPRENLADVDAALLPGARYDLGVVIMAGAVREGAPKRDISTPEALKATLLDVKSLTYMDPTRGTSGKHFDEAVLPQLGVRDAVRAKTTFGEGGFIAEKVARGEVEIVFHQLTEMLPVAGITILGPLPEALQKKTIYTGAVMGKGAHPAEARALLEYLVSPAGRQHFLDRGFSAP